MDPAETLIIGRISGLYGVKGWVRVHSYTQQRAAILDLMPWMLKLNGVWQEHEVASGRVHDTAVVAQIAGYTDREQARALLGAEIAVRRERLPALAADDYYWTDLIGLRVVNRAGQELGTIARLIETGANDVLVVKGEHEILIPYVPQVYILAVSLDERVITVDWPADGAD